MAGLFGAMKERRMKYEEIWGPKIGAKTIKLMEQENLPYPILIISWACVLICVMIEINLHLPSWTWIFAIIALIVSILALRTVYIRYKQWHEAMAEYLGASPEVMKMMPPRALAGFDTGAFDDWCNKNNLKPKA